MYFDRLATLKAVATAPSPPTEYLPKQVALKKHGVTSQEASEWEQLAKVPEAR
jgi:hypothetical protein